MPIAIEARKKDTGSLVQTYTFPMNPEELVRSSITEWRIRHVGTAYFPKARWRRRITDTLRLRGRLKYTDADNLRKFFLLPYPQDTKEEIVFHLTGATQWGISSTEAWVPSEPVEISTVSQYKGGEQMAMYRLVLQKVK